MLRDEAEQRCGRENMAGQMRVRVFADALASKGGRGKLGNTHPQIFFNKFLQNSYSRKFRPAKYKRYTVFAILRKIFEHKIFSVQNKAQKIYA